MTPEQLHWLLTELYPSLQPPPWALSRYADGRAHIAGWAVENPAQPSLESLEAMWESTYKTAWVSSHPVRVMPFADFLDRIGPVKQAEILASAQGNPTLQALLFRAASQAINLDSPALQAGLGFLVSLGLLTSGERDLLLAGGSLV